MRVRFVQFVEGIIAMGIREKLVGRLEIGLARVLAPRAASPLILAGTLAFAGLGAAAMNPVTAQQAQRSVVPAPTLLLNSPHTFCHPDSDGDGHTVCHVLASQVNTVPNMGCYDDPDGDGTSICYYATDPTASN
jgi:hypothetical protein